jgi:MinD superfamily P-loop ATPase
LQGEAAETPSEKNPQVALDSSQELVIISGKGGTGKTSIAASFIALQRDAVVADCDVDAADLHLVLSPEVAQTWPFSGGHEAVIDPEACTGCGLCADLCRFDAVVRVDGVSKDLFEIDPVSCEGCGVCADNCPEGAARMVASVNGEWFISAARHGPMVHARLGVAQENSGKLVYTVRREAKAVADTEGLGHLIVDGAPGIGCPVIASITGAQMALIVTEPTLSGLHDMKRVGELTRHFNMKAAVCINKADINPEIAERLEAEALDSGIPVLGRIRYDASVTQAQVRGVSVVEAGPSPAADEIRAVWTRVKDALAQGPMKLKEASQ